MPALRSELGPEELVSERGKSGKKSGESPYVERLILFSHKSLLQQFMLHRVAD